MNFALARHNMIERQIRPWDVFDERVLAAMQEIPREQFVPPAYQSVAYADTPLPIENGHTILAPREQAKMLQALRVQPIERVFEIGTGSGYGTALLSKLADTVVSIDIDPHMSERASARLKALGLNEKVQCIVGDALASSFDEAQFDVIIINASLSTLPDAFKHALRIGGRLFAVLSQAPCMQATLVTRTTSTHWQQTIIFETVTPRLVHGEKPVVFEF